jgi:glycolate oxidase
VDAWLRARLVEVVGAEAVDDRLEAVSPRSTGEVAAVGRACAARGTPISVVSGAADRRAPGGVAVTVSLGRVDGIGVDPGAMVARAGAGATLAALRSAVEDLDMALIEVPGGAAAAHAGSLVARGQVPRRALTGIEAVLPTGEVVRSGGNVLKDVTGYDLAGILLGSMGWLALVTEVSFRLQPRRARVATEAAPRAPGAVSDLLRHAFDPDRLLVAAR